MRSTRDTPEAELLRRNDLKEYREGRDAALFCLGMIRAQGTTVFFARLEAQDYDFVTLWQMGDETVYTPVQLKEVVCRNH